MLNRNIPRFNTLVWQEDNLFVAKTLELELASQGKTPQEAIKNLTEAIELYFEDTPISKNKLPFYHSLQLTQVSPRLTYA